MSKLWDRLKNGIITENPTFVQMLGMCPTLAVTTSAINAMGMGLATTTILVMSNFMISLFRKVIPSKVRIPAYIIIIASFVTIVQFLMEGFLPDLYSSLGIFIPLIVVNCLILGRAESFASKNPVLPSIFDGIGMGLGFTGGLTIIGIVREFLGSGKIFNFRVLPESFETIGIFVLAPGAFFVLAFIVAISNKIKINKAKAGNYDAELCSLSECAKCGNVLCKGKLVIPTTELKEEVKSEIKKEVKNDTINKNIIINTSNGDIKPNDKNNINDNNKNNVKDNNVSDNIKNKVEVKDNNVNDNIKNNVGVKDNNNSNVEVKVSNDNLDKDKED